MIAADGRKRTRERGDSGATGAVEPRSVRRAAFGIVTHWLSVPNDARYWSTPAAVLAVVMTLIWPAVTVGQTVGFREILFAFEPHGELVWRRGDVPVLRATPRRGDGWLVLAERLCGHRRYARALRDRNRPLTRPLLDRPVSIPLTMLSSSLRLEAVRRVFAADRRIEKGWEHTVLEPFDEGTESWSFLADVFLADPSAVNELRRSNRAVERLSRGTRVLIPNSLLRREFANVPVAAHPEQRAQPRPEGGTEQEPVRGSGGKATPLPRQVSGLLTFARDGRGEYAEYRIRQGEALYSAVVVRFTGQLHAAEVNATALEIARRSGIADVTAIPVGYPVKIPIDLVAPEYLPEDHPRRQQWRQEQEELARFVEVVHAADLSGVHVILDSGHGGVDSGAEVDGIWEATYAYDVMCRIKMNLERHTRATVWTLIRDQSRRYSVPDRDRLTADRDQVLLTEPAYDLSSSIHGVHLRWYLVNRIVRERLEAGVPPAKIVFVSVHADSLHPSVRGAMAYIPSRALRPERYAGRSRAALQRFAEYRAEPTVTFSRSFRSRAEASSRRLAEHLVAALTAEGLAVHPYKPIRDSILRGRERWVPAVLKGSRSQTSVLLEICNLANEEDQALVLDWHWRERFARATVRGIAAAFDGASR